MDRQNYQRVSLCQRRLRWLDRVHRMNDGRITIDILYSEPATRSCPTGHTAERLKFVTKWELKVIGINSGRWEQPADDREENRNLHLGTRRQRKKRKQSQTFIQHSDLICHTCRKRLPCKNRSVKSPRTQNDWILTKRAILLSQINRCLPT